MAQVRIDLMRERMDAWASQTGAMKQISSHASRDALEHSEELDRIAPGAPGASDAGASGVGRLRCCSPNPDYCL